MNATAQPTTIDAPSDWACRIAFFQGVSTPVGVQRDLSLAELVGLLANHETRELKDGRLFSFANYHPDRVRRCDTGVASLSGLVLDVDNAAAAQLKVPPTTPASFAAALSGIAYGVYSTHSHTPSLPKWRLWVPLARPIGPSDFRDVFRGLLALLADDQNVDRSSGDLSRAYYLPSAPKDRRQFAFAQFMPGQLAQAAMFSQLSRSGAPSNTANLSSANGRNDKMKEIASAMIARGENNEAIVWELLSIDQRLAQPLFADSTEGYDADPYTNCCTFVASIRRSINRARATKNEPPLLPTSTSSDAAVSVATRLRIVDVSTIGSSELRPPKFILFPLFPREQVTLLGAHGGVGKSTLALTMAAHVACGRQWASLDPGGGEANVAFLSLEDSETVLLTRLRLIAEEYGLDQAVLSRRLRVIDGSDSDGALMSESSTAGVRHLMRTETFKEFEELVRSASFIVVDNASDAFDGNENDRRMVRCFVRSLQHVARENGAGLLLLTHIDKASAKFGAARNSYSGSTAWHNSARSRLAMNVQDDGTILLVQEKSNYAALAQPLALAWSNRKVLVPNSLPNPVEIQPLLDSTDDSAVLEAMAAAENAGFTIPTARTGPSTAQNVLATLPELATVLAGRAGRNRFWRAVERLRRSGRIAIDRYRDASRHERQRFILVCATTAVRGNPPIPPAN